MKKLVLMLVVAVYAVCAQAASNGLAIQFASNPDDSAITSASTKYYSYYSLNDAAIMALTGLKETEISASAISKWINQSFTANSTALKTYVDVVNPVNNTRVWNNSDNKAILGGVSVSGANPEKTYMVASYTGSNYDRANNEWIIGFYTKGDTKKFRISHIKWLTEELSNNVKTSSAAEAVGLKTGQFVARGSNDYTSMGSWVSAAADPEPIPEPTSGLLMLLGLAGLSLKRKRLR